MNSYPYNSQKRFQSNQNRQTIKYESFKQQIHGEQRRDELQRRNSTAQEQIKKSRSPNPKINHKSDTSPSRIIVTNKSQVISPQNNKKVIIEEAENISPFKRQNQKQTYQQYSDERIHSNKMQSRNNSASPAKINPQIQSSLEQLQNLEKQRLQCKLKGNQLEGVLQNLHNKLKQQSDTKRSPNNKSQNNIFFSSSKKFTKAETNDEDIKFLGEQLQEAEQDKKQLIESIRQYKVNFEKLQCLYSALQTKYDVESKNESYLNELTTKIGEMLQNIQNSQLKALQINLKDIKAGSSDKLTTTQLLLSQKICDLIEVSQSKVRNQEYLLIDLQQNQYKLQNELNSFKEKNYHLQNIVSAGEGYTSYAQTFLESPTAKKMIFVLENELKIKDGLVKNLMLKVQSNEDSTVKLCDQVLKTIDKTCSTQDNFHENLTKILENQKSEIDLKNKHIQDLNEIISKYKSDISIYEELELNNIQFNKQNFDKLIDLVDNMDQKIKIITFENQQLKQNTNFEKLQEINMIERQYFESDLNFKKQYAILQNQYEFETKFLEVLQDYAKLSKQHLNQEQQQGYSVNSYSIALQQKIEEDLTRMQLNLQDIQKQMDKQNQDMIKGIYFSSKKIEASIKPLTKEQIYCEKIYQFGQSPIQQNIQNTNQKPINSPLISNKQVTLQNKQMSPTFQQQNERSLSPIQEKQSFTERNMSQKQRFVPPQTQGKFVFQIDCIIGLKSEKIIEKIKATHVFLKVFMNSDNLFVSQLVQIEDMKFNRQFEVFSVFDNPQIRIEIWMVCDNDQKEIYFSETTFDAADQLHANVIKSVQGKIANYPGCIYYKVKFQPSLNQRSNTDLKKIAQNDTLESSNDDIRKLLPQFNTSDNLNSTIRNSNIQSQNMSDLLYEDNYKKPLVHQQNSEINMKQPNTQQNQNRNQYQINQQKHNIFEEQNEQMMNKQEEGGNIRNKVETFQLVDIYKSENQFLQPQDTMEALTTPKINKLI